jgi:hypothetical protein
MHHSESCAAGDRRFIWIAVFAVALGLSLVNAGAAFAGGEHPSQGQGYPTSWGDTSDEGHPPPEAPAPETPCTEEEKPPGHETPPVETPPVETPPVVTPPVEAPPVQTQPVVTPPVQTPLAPTPEQPTTPVTPESPTAPRERGGGGGEVLPQEQRRGGGQAAPTTEAGVQTAPAVGTLPFTGAPTALLMLFGAVLLGFGVGLRRMATERG